MWKAGPGPGLLNLYLLTGAAVEKQVTGSVPQCLRLYKTVCILLLN